MSPSRQYAQMTLFCAVLLQSFAPTAHADTPLDTYRAKALRIEPGFYTTFELKRLDGTPVNFDHFGSEFETVFADSPEAVEDAKRFRDMRIASTVLNVAGVSVLLSELVLILLGHHSVIDNNKSGASGLKPLTFALLGSGLALNIGGILLEVSSLGVLDNAVQHYNESQLPPGLRGAKLELRMGF